MRNGQAYATVIWNPRLPPFGLSGAFTFYPSESEWSLRSPGTTVSGDFPRPYCWTHTCGTPFVKQITNGAHRLKVVGSHEVKTLIFERQANKLQRLLNAQGMSTCLYCRSSFIDTPGKMDNETQQTTSTVVLIAQIITELRLFQLIQLTHFDDCIQCDLTIQELIRLIKACRTLTQFTCANRWSKSSWNHKWRTVLCRCTFRNNE